ncbi:MAG: hypothetical protein AVDCRST_MAG20-1465, partial [uncultured Acidimicrobiales bacterium]
WATRSRSATGAPRSSPVPTPTSRKVRSRRSSAPSRGGGWSTGGAPGWRRSAPSRSSASAGSSTRPPP